MTLCDVADKSMKMLSRKTRTKMQDLRRASSWKPKKDKRLSILARSKSEGEPMLPDGKASTPPIVPRKSLHCNVHM